MSCDNTFPWGGDNWMHEVDLNWCSGDSLTATEWRFNFY